MCVGSHWVADNDFVMSTFTLHVFLFPITFARLQLCTHTLIWLFAQPITQRVFKEDLGAPASSELEKWLKMTEMTSF